MTLIKIVNGDLLEAKENLILHQVNAQGKMGSGVADQIKKKWYGVYKSYKALCDTNVDNDLLGFAHFVKINDNQAVVNMFGQRYYGYNGTRYTNYEAIYQALEEVSRVARSQNLSVALPYKMGCDRGGANWNVIYTMIEELFKNHTKPVVIYNFGGQWEHSFKGTLPPSPIQEQEALLN